MIYTFNSGDTTSITSNVTIVAIEPIRINAITLNGINTNQTQTGTVTITIRDSTDSSNTYTEAITVDANDTFSITFYPNFMPSNQNATITISTTRTRATVYGGSTRAEEKYIAGLGAYISSNNMFNCTVNMELVTSVWVIGSSGYAELYANPYTPWEDWERDEDGYPSNISVWKVDGNNLGYPWIYGFSPYMPPQGGVLIKVENELIPYDVYMVYEGNLVKCSVFIKTEEGLSPVISI